MSDSNRVFDAAIRIGLIALILMAGVILAPMALRVVNGDHPYPDRGANNASNASHGSSAAPPNGAEREGAVQPQTAEQRAETRDAADVKAQQSMARAAWAQVAVGSVGLVGLMLTVAFAFLAWQESKRSADAAETELGVARKPRLIPETEGPLYWEGTIPCLRVRLHNAGATHAHLDDPGQSEIELSDGIEALRITYDKVTAQRLVVDEQKSPFVVWKKPIIAPGDSEHLILKGRAVEPGLKKIAQDGQSGCLGFTTAVIPYCDHLGRDWEMAFLAMSFADRTPNVIRIEDRRVGEDENDLNHPRPRGA